MGRVSLGLLLAAARSGDDLLQLAGLASAGLFTVGVAGTRFLALVPNAVPTLVASVEDDRVQLSEGEAMVERREV